MIKKNKQQLHKEVWTLNQEGEQITVLKAYTDNEEGRQVAHSIFDAKVNNQLFNKDFAIAYDRAICLKNGLYYVDILGYGDATNTYANVYVNGTIVQLVKNDHANTSIQGHWVGYLKRGDYVQSISEHELASSHAAQFRITRLK